MNRSPFAQAKQKDLFEKTVFKSVVEVKGRTNGSADAWEWWIRRNAPPGVKIEVERWREERVDYGVAMREVEKRWLAENPALDSETGEKVEEPRTIDEKLAAPTDAQGLVLKKAEEILKQWKDAEKAELEARMKKKGGRLAALKAMKEASSGEGAEAKKE